jgi:hypothetical protein
MKAFEQAIEAINWRISETSLMRSRCVKHSSATRPLGLLQLATRYPLTDETVIQRDESKRSTENMYW